MNEIQIFSNSEFGDIRTVTIDGEPWFVGRDVAKALGYARPENAVATHCRHSLKQGVPSLQRKDKEVEATVIPEGDMYRLISKSKLKSAEQFEEWVFDEVLPSIRKTGGYKTRSLPQNSMELLELHYKALKEVDEKVDSVSEEMRTVKIELQDLKDGMPVFQSDTKDIQYAIRKKAVKILGGRNGNAYRDNSIRGYVFADIQIELRRQFGVKRYDQIKHKDVPVALEIIEEYKPPIHIRDKVYMANAQQSLDLKGGGAE